MPITLYDALVPGFIRQVDAINALVGKARDWCRDSDIDVQSVLNARLADDMHDFCYQVAVVSEHSLVAIDKVREGLFTPPPASGFAQDFDAMQARLAETSERLNKIDPQEMESLADQVVTFRIGDKHLGDFHAGRFLLTFSQPNFYFHAATAYDLLRMRGMPLTKLDFMGDFSKALI